MEANKASEILNNLYGLLMEMNYHRAPEDFVEEVAVDDDFISKHLRAVKLHRTRAKALLRKNKIAQLTEEFHRFKEQGIEKLQSLLTPVEREELQPLFRKFEGIKEEDEADIIEDQEFLAFITKLKDRLDESGT